MPATLRLAALGLAALALVAAGMPALLRFGDDAFLALALAGAVAAALAARLPIADARPALILILGFGLAMRLVALPSPPILSTDIFRYVWDGRVQAAGINPYRYVPADPALAPLRDALIFPFINRADYAHTIYPPVAQLFFLLVTRVSESPLAIKLGLVLCEGGTVLALLGLLRRLGLPASRVAAYAWHPLPVWEIAGQGHVDGLMVALMMIGIWLALARDKPAAGAVLVALGGLAKPFALLALPPLWRPWRWGMVAAVIATILLAYLPYLSVGAGLLGFLGGGYAEEQGISGGWGFTLLRLWRQGTGPLPHDAALYIALSLAVLIGMSLRFGFRRAGSPERSLRDIALLSLAFLVLFSPEYPWYALIAVPFLAPVPTMAGWVLTVGSLGLYDIVPSDPQFSFETRATLLISAILIAALHDAARMRAAGAGPVPSDAALDRGTGAAPHRPAIVGGAPGRTP
ncbi:glycosyltransferase 87 family protein [Methylobacterium oxalidis]|uniref:glycosyltransferase 87 family protein n=1 Tax=Methylobacterium oxalidis TaxID=944322 RepID=UPI0033153C46